MSRILKYEQKNTWIDELTGVTKLLFFLLWSIVSMITYDTRVLLVMLLFSVVIFKMSEISWKQVGTVFKFILLFLCLNLIVIFFFYRIRAVRSMEQERRFVIYLAATQ